jgi:hypothetical protein
MGWIAYLKVRVSLFVRIHVRWIVASWDWAAANQIENSQLGLGAVYDEHKVQRSVIPVY